MNEMKTMEMIKTDENTSRFASALTTDHVVKCLLKGTPNAKRIAKAFKSYKPENLTPEMINTFDVILSDVFEQYTAQVQEWRKTGDNRPLSIRVGLFKQLLFNRISSYPGNEIIDSLDEFLENDGKEINRIFTNAKISKTDAMEVMVMVSARGCIMLMMHPDFNVDAVARKTSTKKETDDDSETEAINADDTKNEIINIDSGNEEDPEMNTFQKFIKMIVSMPDTISDEEIASFVKTFIPFMDDLISDVKNMVAPYSDKFTADKAAVLLTPSAKLSTTEKGLLMYIDSLDCDSELFRRYLFFIMNDMMKNKDEKNISEDVKFIVRMSNAKTNGDWFVREIIRQAERINKLQDQYNNPEVTKPEPTVPPVLLEEKPEDKKPEVQDSSASPKFKLNYHIGDVVSKYIRFSA